MFRTTLTLGRCFKSFSFLFFSFFPFFPFFPFFSFPFFKHFFSFCLLVSPFFSFVSVSRTTVFYPASSLRVCMHIRSFSVSFDMCWYSHDVTMFPWLSSPKGKSSQRHPHVPSPHVVLCVLGCTRATLMQSMIPTDSLFRHEHKWYSVLVHVPGIQMEVVVVVLDTARSGEVLCFVCNNGDQD